MTLKDANPEAKVSISASHPGNAPIVQSVEETTGDDNDISGKI